MSSPEKLAFIAYETFAIFFCLMNWEQGTLCRSPREGEDTGTTPPEDILGQHGRACGPHCCEKDICQR